MLYLKSLLCCFSLISLNLQQPNDIAPCVVVCTESHILVVDMGSNPKILIQKL